MKTIVLATDYTRPAQVAMDYAAMLARATKAKLLLFNAFQPTMPTALYSRSILEVDVQVELNRQYLAKLAGNLQLRYGIPVESFTTTLNLLDGLNQTVLRFNAEMVVMGVKARTLGQRLFGNATTAVISQADYPVLVVPENLEKAPISRILFACDYGSIGVHHRLAVLTDLARATRAHIEVLHITLAGELMLLAETQGVLKSHAMEKILGDIPHNYHSMVENDVIEGLRKAVRTHKVNLLVMVPRNKHYWDTIFSRSRTREMILETPIPLLILPNRELRAKHRGNADAAKVKISL